MTQDHDQGAPAPAVQFRRTRTGAIVWAVLSTLVLVFFAWALWPANPVQTVGGDALQLGSKLTARHGLLLLLWAALLWQSGRQFRRCRHDVIMDEEGLTDRAAHPERIAWSLIRDIELVAQDRELYTLRLQLASSAVDVDLWGVSAPAQTVHSEAITRWTAARNRPAREAADVGDDESTNPAEAETEPDPPTPSGETDSACPESDA